MSSRCCIRWMMQFCIKTDLLQVKLNDRVYSIKLGVPQGMPTSLILSDIYYQHMIEKIFPVYVSNGLLCTYVDDMLYITENERYATE